MKSQSGRTLLETISLLAVMGILTVSGLQFYAKAMNNIRVNHLMEKVYLLAIEIRNDTIETHWRKKSVDLPRSAKSLAYGFSYDGKGSAFEGGVIKVSINGQFSDKICKILKEKLKDGYSDGKEFSKSGLVKVNGCNEDSTNVVFEFNPTFKSDN